MRQRLPATGWRLVALGAIVVVVIVIAGALSARDGTALGLWGMWGTIAALPFAAAPVVWALWQKAVRSGDATGPYPEIEHELAAAVLAQAQMTRARLIGSDEPGDQAANMSFAKDNSRFREVGGPSEGSLSCVLTYYQALSPGRLVVLGEPGSGKTVLILELQVRLLEARGRDGSIPVPVLVSAASYDVRVDWEDWLVRHLARRFTVSVSSVARLVRDRRILPLVDGIDEMDSVDEQERAQILIQKLNAWMNGREKAPLVVTCRSDRYQTLARGVDRATHIEILPLTGREAAAYLEGQFLSPCERRRWGLVLATLRADSDGVVSRSLATPWRLTLALAVFRDEGDPGQLLEVTPPCTYDMEQYPLQVDQLLLGGYITAALRVHDPDGRFPPDEVYHWLTVMADGLARQARSGGSPTDIRLDLWWQSAGRRTAQRAHMIVAAIPPVLLTLICRAISANCFLWVPVMLGVVLAPLLVVSWGSDPEPRQLKIRHIKTPRDLRIFAFPLACAVLAGLFAGLFAWQVFHPADAPIAFIGFLVAVLVASLNDSDGPLRVVAPRDVIREDGRAGLVGGLGVALLFGFAIGPICEICSAWAEAPHRYDPAFGLVSGFASGTSFGLIFLLTTTGWVCNAVELMFSDPGFHISTGGRAEIC